MVQVFSGAEEVFFGQGFLCILSPSVKSKFNWSEFSLLFSQEDSCGASIISRIHSSILCNCF